MRVFRHPSLPSLPTQTPYPTLFAQLPLELREQIYTHVLGPSSSPRNIILSTFTYPSFNLTHLPPHLPTLCRVNARTRTEVLLWFLRTTEFMVLSPQDITPVCNFLNTFSADNGFAALRRLEFPTFCYHKPVVDGSSLNPRNAYIAFMQRCPGLTTVTIKLEMWRILKHPSTFLPSSTRVLGPDESFGRLSLLGLEELVDAYRLADLFDLQSLTVLTIEVWPKVLESERGFGGFSGHFRPLMEELAEFLRRGFEEKGRCVDVRLVESGTQGLRWVLE